MPASQVGYTGFPSRQYPLRQMACYNDCCQTRASGMSFSNDTGIEYASILNRDGTINPEILQKNLPGFCPAAPYAQNFLFSDLLPGDFAKCDDPKSHIGRFLGATELREEVVLNAYFRIVVWRRGCCKRLDFTPCSSDYIKLAERGLAEFYYTLPALDTSA